MGINITFGAFWVTFCETVVPLLVEEYEIQLDWKVKDFWKKYVAFKPARYLTSVFLVMLLSMFVYF